MSLNVVQTEASRLTQSELNHYLKSDVPFIQQWAAHERIGILIQDPAQFMRVYQAIQGAGYLPVVLDSKWTSEQLHEILAHYQVTQVIADKQIEDVHTVRLE